MKQLYNILCLLILISLIHTSRSLALEAELVSPNGKISVNFSLNEKGEPIYSIQSSNIKIIEGSRLGVVLQQGGKLQDHLEIKSISDSKTIDSTYYPVLGKKHKIRNHFNQLTISLQEKKFYRRKLNLTFRAYNDGIAFRYGFPLEEKSNDLTLIAELSEFNFVDDYPCWAQHLPHFNSNYEAPFDQVTLNTIYGKAELKDPIMQYLFCFDFPADKYHRELIGLPLLVDIQNGPVLAIAEADLKDYPGMYLQKRKGSTPALNSILSPLRNENGISAKFSTPHSSPWRVIMIGEGPADLIESNIIYNLNRPLAIDDPSWIKPGKSAWDFLAGRNVAQGLGFEGGMNMKTLKYYIDFAAEFNLEYSLIDLGWCPGVGWKKENPAVDQLKAIDGIDIPKLVKYAEKKGVGLILWARWNNIRDDMERVFSTFEKWGIKGVKIDFMDSDDQYMVNWYEKCISTAAKYHLLINFHGAYKPTGLSRTWPNYITQEGVKGLEWANTDKNLTTKHNVTLAYTRMLVGPMDYTPGGFNNVLPEDHTYMHFEVITTRAHQLAMLIVYESPLMVLADAPHAYKGRPESEFIKTVPSSWDDTRFIEGKIGEYIVLARKKSTGWYIGGMTNSKERKVTIPLSFLDNNKAYITTIYEDSPNANTAPKEVNIRKKEIKNTGSLNIKMKQRGGFAIHIKPID